MYFCYLDESGTVAAADLSSLHFVLVGLAILAPSWKHKDVEIDAVKKKYGFENQEAHTAWMLREYPEQKVIPDFELQDFETRKRLVLAVRTQNIARQRSDKSQKDLIKQYRATEPYMHLTRGERLACVQELADLIGSWSDALIFAEAQQKRSLPNGCGDFEEAFEQVVTRFNTCLKHLGSIHGLLIQDNNETVAKKLTTQMRKFHAEGTTWTKDIEFVGETPLFVDSELTSMVQLADLCAYAIRRFFDKGEADLINRIAPRFDRRKDKLVGVRHFTRADSCSCSICLEHGRRPLR